MRLYSILIFALLLALPASLPSCQSPITIKQPSPQVNATNTTPRIVVPDMIKVCSWNLQIYGDSKSEKPEVMAIIAKVIQNCDVIALQEIRDADDSSIPALMESVNSLPGRTYKYVMSDPLGRTSSKEQYLILYKNNTITLEGTRQFPDPKDLFEREPFSAKFRVGNFDFVLIDVHVKPDDAVSEIDDLDRVMEDASAYFNEKDIIVGGDLNADCSYFPDGTNTVMREQQYQWVVEDWEDTTTRGSTCAYDRFIIDKTYTAEDYTGEYAIFNFKNEYKLSDEQADQISDHFPIWMTLHSSKDTG